jgi:hypothetical protein
MHPVSATASYAIDPRGVILWTDEGFARLAAEYGVPDLAHTAAGRPLGEFVAGERPRALQDALLERARRADQRLELRYRCDAPEMRRFAVLEIAPEPDGGAVFTTWFESTEERPHLPLIDTRLARDGGAVRLCAWCNRIDVDGWREAEEAAQHVPLSPLPRVEHDVCDVCEMLLTPRLDAG